MKPRLLYLQTPVSLNDKGDAFIPSAAVENYADRTEFNVGDFLVCDATIKFFGHPSKNFQFSELEDITPEFIKQCREEYDYVVVRGSNYINAGFDFTHVSDFLETLDLPIIVVGLGIQAPYYVNIDFTPSDKRFLEVLSAKTVNLGVRGNYTAEQFSRSGIKNIAVLGCPTVVRKKTKDVVINKKTDFQSLGLTLNRNLNGIYSFSKSVVDTYQTFLLKNTAKFQESYIISQGEKSEFELAFGLDHGNRALEEICRYYRIEKSDESTRRLIKDRTRLFLDVSQWEKFIGSLDFVFGLRLHGNIIALQHGVPSVFFTYDSRTQELVDLFRLPHVNIAEFYPISIRRLYEKADFGEFIKHRLKIIGNWNSFLAQLGMPELAEIQMSAGEIAKLRIEGWKRLLKRRIFGNKRFGFAGDREMRRFYMESVLDMGTRVDYAERQYWLIRKRPETIAQMELIQEQMGRQEIEQSGTLANLEESSAKVEEAKEAITADAPVVHLHKNSPEKVAYDLMIDILGAEWVEGEKRGREQILDIYKECLATVRGARSMEQKLSHLNSD